MDAFLDRYVRGDDDERARFDRRLARYLREFDETWRVNVLTDALDDIGATVADARVRLERLPDGRLAVTIGFALPPTAVRSGTVPAW